MKMVRKIHLKMEKVAGKNFLPMYTFSNAATASIRLVVRRGKREVERERERERGTFPGFEANSSLFPSLFSPPLSDLYFQFS